MAISRTVAKLEDFRTNGRPENWLSPAEWLRYNDLSRKGPAVDGWLGGRWCAKRNVRAVTTYQATHPTQIHIESYDGLQRRISPRVFLRGRLQPWRLSLSHSETLSAAVLSTHHNHRVGVDIVNLEDRPGPLPDYWFNKHEQSWCTSETMPVLIWGLKEAIFKAIGDDCRFVPREVDITKWFAKADIDYLRVNRYTKGGDYPLRHGATVSWETHEQELVLYFAVFVNGRKDTSRKNLLEKRVLLQ